MGLTEVIVEIRDQYQDKSRVKATLNSADIPVTVFSVGKLRMNNFQSPAEPEIKSCPKLE